MCQTLLLTIEDVLTSNKPNLFTLRRMFFPAGAEPPELLNVTYHLHFTNSFPASLPNCTCTGTDPHTEQIFIDPQRDLTLRYGWTVIGLYTLIHPALLNQLQFPLPFSIMRLVASDGVPFLWNGYQSLPSAEVVLNIDPSNLTCLPDTYSTGWNHANSDITGELMKTVALYDFVHLVTICFHLCSCISIPGSQLQVVKVLSRRWTTLSMDGLSAAGQMWAQLIPLTTVS